MTDQYILADPALLPDQVHNPPSLFPTISLTIPLSQILNTSQTLFSVFSSAPPTHSNRLFIPTDYAMHTTYERDGLTRIQADFDGTLLVYLSARVTDLPLSKARYGVFFASKSPYNLSASVPPKFPVDIQISRIYPSIHSFLHALPLVAWIKYPTKRGRQIVLIYISTHNRFPGYTLCSKPSVSLPA